MGAAYVIGQVTVKDPDKWEEYQSAVPATFRAWGGDKLAGGKQFAALAGEMAHPDVVVLQFPDRQALENWFNSEEYQGLTELRDAAAEVVLTAYES